MRVGNDVPHNGEVSILRRKDDGPNRCPNVNFCRRDARKKFLRKEATPETNSPACEDDSVLSRPAAATRGNIRTSENRTTSPFLSSVSEELRTNSATARNTSAVARMTIKAKTGTLLHS